MSVEFADLMGFSPQDFLELYEYGMLIVNEFGHRNIQSDWKDNNKTNQRH